VIGLLQSASALLLPSLSETFGLVILEAWAAGAPVVSARASGPAALVKSGLNGWLFDVDHPDSFHEAVSRTLGNPGAAKDMARCGGRVSEEYSVDALAGRLKNLYQELIDEKRCTT
jgi:glycosyltransferase involved in cell wall biosynthesis